MKKAGRPKTDRKEIAEKLKEIEKKLCEQENHTGILRREAWNYT